MAALSQPLSDALYGTGPQPPTTPPGSVTPPDPNNLPDTIKPWNPSWRDQLGFDVNDAMRWAGFGRDYSDSVSGGVKDVASLAPISGNVLSADDAYTNFKTGHPILGALSTLGAIAPPGFGSAEGAAARGVEEGVANAASRSTAEKLADLARPETPAAPTPPIVAYHGSPYAFDQFDTSKIGTGEGAQAYGHGLYFAEQEAVARQYRDELQWKGSNFDDPQVLAQNAIVRNGDRETAARSLESALNSTTNFYRGKVPAAQAAANANTQRAIDLLRSPEPITGAPKNTGSMYQVGINANPDHFLDWDAPVADGHAVRSRLQELSDEAMKSDDPADRNAGRDAYTAASNPALSGEGAYKSLAKVVDATRPYLKNQFGEGALFQSPSVLAAQDMDRMGVPGIKYLDAGSRGVGDGSRNYVVFSDKMIDILKKYGVAGLSASPLLDQLYSHATAPADSPSGSVPAQSNGVL